MTWTEFLDSEPELARIGRNLLWLDKPGKGGLAYLSTIRADGGPRIHPISPAIVDERLYVFVLKGSPKRDDLSRNGRYALHSFPDSSLYKEQFFNDEEFFVAGRANLVKDMQTCRAVAKACGDEVETGDVFELTIERAMHKRREKGKPIYTKWSIIRARLGG